MIHHAFPVSFIAMCQTRYDTLPDERRVQLVKAALSIQVSNPMRRVS
ncbi:inner membrane glycosyltransferase [Burkholderia pseudomallei 305]|nr:inner membrane glycosyltransferase [Burkholderia pseudomallei 305]